MFNTIDNEFILFVFWVCLIFTFGFCPLKYVAKWTESNSGIDDIQAIQMKIWYSRIKNYAPFFFLSYFVRNGPGWFWLVHLHWHSFTTKVFFVGSRTRKLSSVWSSLPRYNKKNLVNIPVWSQPYYVDHGLPFRYVQLHHVPDVQAQHRYVSFAFDSNKVRRVWNIPFRRGRAKKARIPACLLFKQLLHFACVCSLFAHRS